MALNKQSIKKYKPSVNRSVHLFAAPLLWTLVGLMLVVRGLGWIGYFNNGWFILSAFVIGSLKSIFILDKTAKRGIQRVVHMQDGTCLGAVYSWKTWLLVFLMSASGKILRCFVEPGSGIGTVYVAVGWALILSSRHGWLAWSRWVFKKE